MQNTKINKTVPYQITPSQPYSIKSAIDKNNLEFPEIPQPPEEVPIQPDVVKENKEVNPSNFEKKPLKSSPDRHLPAGFDKNRWDNDPILSTFSGKGKKYVIVPKSRLQGDINQDGTIDIRDLQDLKKKFLTDVASTVPKRSNYNDDVDGDGKFTIKDINKLSKIIEGKSKTSKN